MDLRERIVENSVEMFLSKGCKTVTMDEIATENGISKRTLYEHFRDKNTLLEECLNLMQKRMVSFTETFMAESKSILDMVCMVHEHQSDLMINMRINFFDELNKFYPEVFKNHYSRFLDFHKKVTIEFLQRGQDQGFFLKDIDKELVTKVLIEISSLIENSDVFSLKNHTRKQLFRESVIIYFRGISTTAGIKMIDKYLNIKE
jgi:AcrR family transcriptional regulator